MIPEDLRLDSYDYSLNQELVAQRPIEGRHHSRLMVYDHAHGELVHTHFRDLDEWLPQGAMIVVNESKVFPCRLLGKKLTGAKTEVFILSLEGDCAFESLVRTGNKKNVGDTYLFPDQLRGRIVELTEKGSFLLEFFFEEGLALSSKELKSYLSEHGLVPVPPYIRKGLSDQQDLDDYQTIFADKVGSVAAPTAGLHFTDEVFEKLARKDIEVAKVCLHVGPGTFAPVKSEDIRSHQMHGERFSVDKKHYESIAQAVSEKRPLVAVGTTSLRTLFSAMNPDRSWKIEAGKHYETHAFIHPGVDVSIIDGLITNFHLPKSSLLMLVSALVGRKKVLELYERAQEEKYRFFSYGDAMLLWPNGIPG